jgi:hypothetical protein
VLLNGNITHSQFLRQIDIIVTPLTAALELLINVSTVSIFITCFSTSALHKAIFSTVIVSFSELNHVINIG